MVNECITNEELYDIIKSSNRVVLPHDFESNDIEPKDIYFSLNKIPSHGIRRLFFGVYRFLEFNCMSILRIVKAILKKTGKYSLLIIDGNAYAVQALKRNAGYVVVDNKRIVNGSKFLLVDNVYKALKDMAILHREQLKAKFIGITGSCGKTTTKELVRNVLSMKYSCESTIENHNCFPWIPQRVLNMDRITQFGVFEMGVTCKGEITKYCKIVKPDSGIITCIGKTHFQYLHSIDQVEKAKKELFDYLTSKRGHIFLNLDDPRLASFGNSYPHITTFGSKDNADIRGEVVDLNPFLRIKWRASFNRQDSYIVQTKLYGAYNLANILSAIAVGLYYDIPLDMINEAIEAYEPVELRSQLIREGSNRIIVDAYNANPTSMKASLESFYRMKSKRKIAFIGDMLELGDSSSKEHRDIVSLCEDFEFDEVIFIGKEFLKVKDKNVGFFFPNVRRAKGWAKKQDFANSDVFLKGSRGISVEKILRFIN